MQNDTMAQLIKHYPTNPHKNIILSCGDAETMKIELNQIQSKIEINQMSKLGTTFIEIFRYDDFTLNTCIYKNVDTDEEQTLDINYYII